MTRRRRKPAAEPNPPAPTRSLTLDAVFDRGPARTASGSVVLAADPSVRFTYRIESRPTGGG